MRIVDNIGDNYLIRGNLPIKNKKMDFNGLKY